MSVISFSLVEDAMKTSYYGFSLILLFLGLMMLFTGSAASASDSAVEGEINIELIDATTFRVEFFTDVEFITLPANQIRYSQDDIEKASSEILGAIKYALKSDIVSQMKSSFPDCTITSSFALPQYNSGVFFDKYNVSLTSAFFSLNDSISSAELINGLLDAGVFVNFSYPWSSLQGWNNTYTLVLSNQISFKSTDGKVVGKKISWDVFNGEGVEQKQNVGLVSLKDSNPTTNPAQNETVTFVFSLNCRDPNEINMSILMKANRLNMKKYDCLPSILFLPSSLPADAIRLCVDCNLTDYDQIKKISLNDYINYALDSLNSSSFNQSFDMSFLWNNETTDNCTLPYVINAMDEYPPVTGLLVDHSVDLSFFNISGKAFFGLINAGGQSNIVKEDVNFADVFDDLSLGSSEVYLPSHVLFNQSDMISWNHSYELNGVFTSDNAPSYEIQNIARNYDIDIKSTDLNLLSFFTGKNEVNLGIGFEKTRNVFVMTRSPSLSIPEEIKLPFLNADGLRLCIDEKVFPSEEINQYIDHHESELENISRRLFPSIKGNAVNDKNAFEKSLDWDGNISSMDANHPVIFKQVMESTAPLSCQFSIIPLHFSFATQNLTFIGVPNENVSYNMTFPKGISINVISTSQPIIQQITDEGQMRISVELEATDMGKVANVVLTMEPTILYIIGLFVPCIISIFITILLFLVVYVIRKKRNMVRQNKQRPPFSDHNEGYEHEDYYVPPKPPSSR